LIVNTTKSPEEIKKITKFNGKVITVDATGVSIATVGREAPNIPTIGSLIKETNILKLESVEKALDEIFSEKIGKNGVQKNIEALKRGYMEVRS